VLPLDLALGQVGVVPAVDLPDLALGQVELDDARDRAGEELAVVADDDGADAQPGDEPFEDVEPAQVEVVGRLVERDQVEAGQQQRRQPGPRRLAAGEAGHCRVEGHAEPDLVEHGRRPLVEVGAAEGQPALQRGRVAVVGPVRPGAERGRGVVHRDLRGGHAGAPGQVGTDRLARPRRALLRQVADDGVRRVQRDGAGVGCALAGQDAQQRRLAGAVRADQADDVTLGDDEVEIAEQNPGPVLGRDAGGDQRRTHAGQGSWLRRP
jgi:hypothetical protein